MNADFQAMFKAMAPRFAAKAIRTFDQATLVVVGVCWGVAILMIIFALYAMSLSASTRREAETIAAEQPVLPTIDHKPLDVHDAQPLLDRLQHTYPGISFILNNDETLTISAADATKFREWLAVLSYVSVVSPKFRWTLKEFCVGKCSGNSLMRALLAGEKITFESSHAKEKDKR